MTAIIDHRFARPTLYGVAVTFGLFAALFLTIIRGTSLAPEGLTATTVFLRDIKDTPVEPTPLRRPVRIEPPQAPQRPHLTVDAPPHEAPPVPITMPSPAALPGAAPGLTVDGRRESDLIPLVRVAPQYPRQALRDGTEGWVDLEVVVNPDGTVRSARAASAQPRGVFEAAAVQAMLRSKFKPKVVDGIAVEQTAVQRVDFKMEAAK
jgi:protein TonB